MRTLRSRNIRRRSLLRARIYGHKPVLISHHGALALYGCMNCNVLMEIWDNPDCVSGPMPQGSCKKKLSWWRKLLVSIIPI